MARPPRIPVAGDVPAAKVAAHLGLSDLRAFTAALPELRRRGFPAADPTTGNFCIEAVDRWRRRRHPELFPELTTDEAVTDAEVLRRRLAERRGGRGEDTLLRRP